MADVICSSCGHRNPYGANFCSLCGTPLEVGVAGEHTVSIAPVEAELDGGHDLAFALDDVPDGVGLVIVTHGPGEGSRFVLDSDLVSAGRHPECDLFLDDVTVSRHHAEIRRDEEGYHLRDLGSLNGTYLNRTRTDDVLLTAGDELQIGRFKLVFLIRDPVGGAE